MCGYVRTVAPTHTHTYGDWSKDATNHWHECTDAHCPDKTGSVKDTAQHVYDNAADTDCNVCGYVRTVAPTHTHTYGDWSKDATNHWHECTDAHCPDKTGSVKDTAQHVYDNAADTDCNVCGYVRTVAPTHTHTYGDWSKDATNHWHECTDAHCPDKTGSVKDTAQHTFEWKVDREATKSATGLKHEECAVCGYKRSENTIIGKVPSNSNTSTVPQTGDGSHIILWVIALVMSGSALAVTMVISRKKKTEQITIFESE